MARHLPVALHTTTAVRMKTEGQEVTANVGERHLRGGSEARRDFERRNDNVCSALREVQIIFAGFEVVNDHSRAALQRVSAFSTQTSNTDACLLSFRSQPSQT
jgi:hypothetical protein